jgi:hypothetical protein
MPEDIEIREVSRTYRVIRGDERVLLEFKSNGIIEKTAIKLLPNSDLVDVAIKKINYDLD